MMKPLTLETIARVTSGRYAGPAELAGTNITGVVHDSREIEQGNLFVCFKGERSDGHSFAPKAFAAGASACLCENEIENADGPCIIVESSFAALKLLGAYYRSLFTIPVIGVTGSVGKTTTKEMISVVLAEKFNVLKTAGNLNNEIGVPLTLLKLRREHEAAVIEMGISAFGEMSRLAEMVRPDICVMTNIGYGHLEALGDLDGVLKAKSEVFSYMTSGSLAIVSGDDSRLRTYHTGTRRITFGHGPDCDYRVENIECSGTRKLTFDTVTRKGRFSAEIPAFGRHLAFDAQPALIIGRELGVPDREIALGLSKYRPVGSRAKVIETGCIRLIDDCYNANPDSMATAISAFGELEGRKVAILGDMLELGRESDELHRKLGALIANSAVDSLICCGQKAEHIHNGLLSVGHKAESRHFHDKEELYSALPSLIREGDCVLVKASHGMHFEEITRRLMDVS